MGSQEERTNVISGTDCPLWDASMQFQVKDLIEDTLCITVFDKGYYSPDGQLSHNDVFFSLVKKIANRISVQNFYFLFLIIQILDKIQIDPLHIHQLYKNANFLFIKNYAITRTEWQKFC